MTAQPLHTARRLAGITASLAMVLAATSLAPAVTSQVIPPPIPIVGGVFPLPSPCPPAPAAAPLFCPVDPTINGSSCLSFPLLVVETDLTGSGAVGNLVETVGRSAALANAAQGAFVAMGPFMPPMPTMGHGEAYLSGTSYTNALLGLTVSSQAAWSSCDVNAIYPPGNPGIPVSNQAVGRAGVEDLTVTLGGAQLLGAEILDFEVAAYAMPGPPTLTMGMTACDVVQLEVGPPVPPDLAYCPLVPYTGLRVNLLPIADVTVRFHEEWGPVFRTGGVTYGGAVLHITVLVPGVTQVDVYVGYTNVLVDGYAGPMPVMYMPNTGCTLLPTLFKCE